ncbi:MAG: hypothetical protein ACLFUC_00160 [Bacteroidales bacterium]
MDTKIVKFIVKRIVSFFVFLILVCSFSIYGQPSSAKKAKKEAEKRKEEVQKANELKVQMALEHHVEIQSPEVQKRMKTNNKKTKKYYQKKNRRKFFSDLLNRNRYKKRRR